MKKILFPALVALALAACGGGGGNSGTPIGATSVSGSGTSSSPGTPVAVTDPTPVAISYPAPATLANICTPQDEKNWVRSHLDDVYLWYRDIVNVNAASYATPADYFSALLVRAKDRFSFTESQAVIDAYFQTGEVVGYGANYVRASDGRLRISYSEPGSPAQLQGVDRGAQIVAINGTPEGQLARASFLAALYPASRGETNTFEVLDAGATVSRQVTLQAVSVVGTPVQKNQVLTLANGKKVGYLLFNDHIDSAEAPFASAMAQFAQAGIDDLVLDVRYNGGGYLYIASEVGYMIGGTPVAGKTFEKLNFNDKHPEKSNDPANTMPFYDGDSNGKALPALGLKRVFVLTGPGTCSASESIINGLKPFVEVITIGGATCGKPYGFIQKNNCGTAYFAIEFEGVNSAGKGGYVNGFAPSCSAADDLEHGFGDSNERLLKTALAYQSAGACPASAVTQAAALQASRAEPLPQRQPWRENRFLTPR
jgi:C-terminal processing protease CtpA/Prc